MPIKNKTNNQNNYSEKIKKIIDSKSFNYGELLDIGERAIEDGNADVLSHIINSPTTSDRFIFLGKLFNYSIFHPDNNLYKLFYPSLYDKHAFIFMAINQISKNKCSSIVNSPTNHLKLNVKQRVNLLNYFSPFLKDQLSSSGGVVKTTIVLKNIIKSNDLSLLRVFLKNVPLKIDREIINLVTAKNNHDALKILLPYADVSDPDFSNVLSFVSSNYDHTDSVNTSKTIQLLLPYTDPKYDNSSALYVACLRSNTTLVDLLFDLSDIEKIEKSINDNFLTGDGVDYFLNKVGALKSKESLKLNITVKSQTEKNTKKRVF